MSSPESRMLLSDLDTVQRVTQKLSVRTSLKLMDFYLVLRAFLKFVNIRTP